RHLGVKEDLQQQITQLGAQLAVVARVDRLDHLVRLLDQIRFDRVVRLLAIPWTSARRAQPMHDRHQLLERLANRHAPRLPQSRRCRNPTCSLRRGSIPWPSMPEVKIYTTA